MILIQVNWPSTGWRCYSESSYLTYMSFAYDLSLRTHYPVRVLNLIDHSILYEITPPRFLLTKIRWQEFGF